MAVRYFTTRQSARRHVAVGINANHASDISLASHQSDTFLDRDLDRRELCFSGSIFERASLAASRSYPYKSQ